ncbi:MAG: sugar transferase [Chloroflexi bacterium]|nr:sugar transferase [Chloroflexota bacterium]
MAGSRAWGSWYKRPFDLGLLVVAHLLLLPLWLLLWTIIPLLIWLGDRGPIFYKQKRIGKNGRVFIILKFRTMVPDADRSGPPWTTEGDPRVTRFGRLLRRTALDELPEVVNIWKGDMSFVGPRALDVVEQKVLEQEIPGFAKRLQILPGLTGLAQIYDTEDTADGKYRYDMEYLTHMSPWQDLKLLMVSVRNTLGARWDRRTGKPPTTSSIPTAANLDSPQVEPINERTTNFRR